MKTFRKITFIFVLSAMTASLSGCFGEFALTRKVYSWNDGVSDSRFVKTFVFWGLSIIPVYGVAGLADLIIFNLLEFWTGSNPIAMAEGEYEYQFVELDGVTYKLEASKNCFTITPVLPSGVDNPITLRFSDTQVIAVTQQSEVVVAEIVH